jgi:hypothetical protein
LQKFGCNSLFTNVNLTLYGENRRKFDAMSKMMTQLMPSITSIESLNPSDCYDHNAALFQEEFSDMLASTRIINGWSGFIPIKKLASTDMENRRNLLIGIISICKKKNLSAI